MGTGCCWERFCVRHFHVRPLRACPPTTRLRNLKVEETGVCRVVRERVFSSAWHPNEEKLLLAVGDKVGSSCLLSLSSWLYLQHAFFTLSAAV